MNCCSGANGDRRAYRLAILNISDRDRSRASDRSLIGNIGISPCDAGRGGRMPRCTGKSCAEWCRVRSRDRVS